MELPGILKGIADRISKKTSVTVEKAPDPVFTAGVERISRDTLIKLYTEPKILRSLGSLPRNMAGFQRFGEDITRIETEEGINTNMVPHLTSNLSAAAAQSADMIAFTREQALAKVASDRRDAIEQEALLEAQRRLNEQLKEENLNRDVRTGAMEMLRRIEDRLKEKTALPEGNPTLPRQ